MQLQLGAIRPLKSKDGAFSFNVLLKVEDREILLNGFRVMNGKIYSPAIAYGKKQYFNVLYGDREFCKTLYDTLAADARFKLVEIEKATRAIFLDRTSKDTFLYEYEPEDSTPIVDPVPEKFPMGNGFWIRGHFLERTTGNTIVFKEKWCSSPDRLSLQAKDCQNIMQEYVKNGWSSEELPSKFLEHKGATTCT